MKYHVEINPDAEQDIKRNAQWWSDTYSQDQAEVWFFEVHEQLKALSSLPLRHQLADEDEQFPYELRQMLVGLGNPRTYRAVYTVQNEIVHVLAVRRASQGPIHPLDLPPKGLQ